MASCRRPWVGGVARGVMELPPPPQIQMPPIPWCQNQEGGGGQCLTGHQDAHSGLVKRTMGGGGACQLPPPRPECRCHPCHEHKTKREGGGQCLTGHQDAHSGLVKRTRGGGGGGAPGNPPPPPQNAVSPAIAHEQKANRGGGQALTGSQGVHSGLVQKTMGGGWGSKEGPPPPPPPPPASSLPPASEQKASRDVGGGGGKLCQGTMGGGPLGVMHVVSSPWFSVGGDAQRPPPRSGKWGRCQRGRTLKAVYFGTPSPAIVRHGATQGRWLRDKAARGGQPPRPCMRALQASPVVPGWPRQQPAPFAGQAWEECIEGAVQDHALWRPWVSPGGQGAHVSVPPGPKTS